jgi:hypothetical protein
MHEVMKHLGSPEFGGDGPYWEYRVSGPNTAIEFWMFPPRDPASETKTGDSLPIEIAYVLKAEFGAKKATQRVVWPRGLPPQEIEAIWKAIWSLDKPSNQAMQLTASKADVYASRLGRRERMLHGMHRGLAAADLVTR